MSKRMKTVGILVVNLVIILNVLITTCYGMEKMERMKKKQLNDGLNEAIFEAVRNCTGVPNILDTIILYRDEERGWKDFKDEDGDSLLHAACCGG